MLPSGAGCLVTSVWSRDAAMGEDSPLAFFLKPVARKGVGVAACQWSVMAWSLGRFVDHCTTREKEGSVVKAQADQVKEGGNVIDAVEGK